MARSKWEDVEGKLLLVEGWARDGLTDEQIAHNLGIAYSTFRVYRDKHSALSAALKKGKEVVDYEVENALLKRALGYEYEEKTYETEYNKDKEKYIERLTKRVTKQVIPDTTAQIYWLNNRKPKQWKNRRNEETNNNEISKVEQLLNKLKEEAEK